MNSVLRAGRERHQIEADYTAGRIDHAEYVVLVAGVEDDLRQARLLPWEVLGGIVGLLVVLTIVILVLRAING